jgi:uncharacterized RDD family membrane protein YckC
MTQAASEALWQGTPDVQPETMQLASWGSRVGAYLIDGVVLAAAVVAITVIGAVVDSNAVILVLFLAWVFAAAIGYWAFWEGRAAGQTPGKAAVGIRVRDLQGGRASHGQAWGRNLVRLLLALIPLVGLVNYLWPLADSRNQCLHDKAAKTIVVR